MISGRKVVLALGACMMTPGVAGAFSKVEVLQLLEAQACGDWGITCEEDVARNDEAVRSGDGRVVALHEVRGVRVFVITEHDRSVTTVLLPEEY